MVKSDSSVEDLAAGEVYKGTRSDLNLKSGEEQQLGWDNYLSQGKKYYEVCSEYFNNLYYQLNRKDSDENMSRRKDKGHEPLGPVYLLKSVRDQVQLFQEKRGILPEENNFVNLLAVMIQQSGQAMYAVFTMFLALLPVASIFIHVAHFILDRLCDIISTRRKQDLWVKGGIFILQLIATYVFIKFITSAIFSPIFSMQVTIISKMLFFDD